MKVLFWCVKQGCTKLHLQLLATLLFFTVCIWSTRVHGCPDSRSTSSEALWLCLRRQGSRSSGSATDQARIDSNMRGHCVTVTAICPRLCPGQTILALLIQRDTPWAANNAASPVLTTTVFFFERIKLRSGGRNEPTMFKAEVRCPSAMPFQTHHHQHVKLSHLRWLTVHTLSTRSTKQLLTI